MSKDEADATLQPSPAPVPTSPTAEPVSTAKPLPAEGTGPTGKPAPAGATAAGKPSPPAKPVSVARRRRPQPAPARIVAIALGVPLALSLLFVILYTTGLIRDERRADYCAVYAPVSADLSLFDNFAADLAEGRPSAVLTTTLELRQRIDALTDQPSTALIHDRLAAMTDYLRRVELAARAHDPEALAELSTRLPVFAANRQQFLNYSAEYCRYR